MKYYLKLLFIFILISVFSVSCIQAKEPETQKANLAPDFKLQDLNQNTFTLSNYRDKQPVVLFFWTTWCPSCRGELRMLNDIYPELLIEGWELLAIDIGERAYRVDNFVKSHPLSFKVLLDKDTAVAYAYDILGVPTYVLVDKKGYIRFETHFFPKKEYKELISE